VIVILIESWINAVQKTCSNCRYCIKSPGGTFVVSDYICSNNNVGFGMPVFLQDPSIKDCFEAKPKLNKEGN